MVVSIITPPPPPQKKSRISVNTTYFPPIELIEGICCANEWLSTLLLYYRFLKHSIFISEVLLTADIYQYNISIATSQSDIQQIKFAPVLSWLNKLPKRPPYDIVFYDLCYTKGLLISRGQRVESGKYYSPNKRYSINFDDPAGVQIYDEASAFGNGRGVFQLSAIEIATNGSVFFTSSNQVGTYHLLQ